MGIGLLLRGTARSAISIERVQGWLRSVAASELRTSTSCEEDRLPTLIVDLHPGAENLRFVFPQDQQITVSAQTSSGGPGYHIYVCALLKKMEAELSVRWEPSPDGEGDETGYFESNDRNEVYESMQSWLRQVCEGIVEMADQGYTGIALSMPLNGVTFRSHQLLVTQMGPRSREWVESIARGADTGRDFFPWWNEERDGRYFLNRALCLMWTEVRWRLPLLDYETDLLQEVRRNLESAYSLDRSLEYPWREWTEIVGYLGEEGRGMAVPQCFDLGTCETSLLIGYRRAIVRVSLVAGWTIEVPGCFADRWEDDTWCGWDQNMTVWFTAFRKQREGVQIAAIDLIREFATNSDDEYSLAAEGVAGKAGIQWFGEDECWKLNARTAANGVFCQCSIYFVNPNDREQALEIWRSLRVRPL